MYRALDQHGQIVDAYVSERCNATAAQTFFEHAIDETGCTPVRVVTDKAKWYPPALREGAPLVEPRTSKYLNNGLERDHGHLKQRLQPTRGVGQAASATLLAWGHALIQNLRTGFSTLTLQVPRQVRLTIAWSQLTQAI